MTRSCIINWWIGRKLDDLHIALGIFGILLSMAGTFSGYPLLTRIGDGGLLFLAVVHLLHLHLHRSQACFKSYEQFDRLPIRQIKLVDAFFMAVFLLAFLLLAFAGTYLPWKALGDVLGNGLLLFIRWLLQLFPVPDQLPVPEEGGGGPAALMPDLPAGETSPVARFLEKVFYLLALILAVRLVVWLVVWGIRRLLRFLGSLRFDEDEKIFLEPESFKEKAVKERKLSFFRRYMPVFDRTHAGRIRRLYWRRVRQRLEQQEDPSLSGRLSAMTPAQIQQELGLWAEGEGACRAHTLYEKARYGGAGCSREEEEEMRTL